MMIKFKELSAYMLVGACATFLDATIFYFLAMYGALDYRIALLCGSIIGILFNFILCDYFIFDRGTKSFFRACMQHYAASLAGLFLNQIGMIILISGLEFEYLYAVRLIVAAFTFMFNYVLIKRYVFADKY